MSREHDTISSSGKNGKVTWEDLLEYAVTDDGIVNDL